MESGLRNIGMVAGQKVRLKKDVYSMVYKSGKDPLKYGSKGENVTIVSDRSPALIVKNRNGFRYPVRKDCVF